MALASCPAHRPPVIKPYAGPTQLLDDGQRGALAAGGRVPGDQHEQSSWVIGPAERHVRLGSDHIAEHRHERQQQRRRVGLRGRRERADDVTGQPVQRLFRQLGPQELARRGRLGADHFGTPLDITRYALSQCELLHGSRSKPWVQKTGRFCFRLVSVRASGGRDGTSRWDRTAQGATTGTRR